MNKKVISGLLALTLVAGGAVGLPLAEGGLSLGNSITASADSSYGYYSYVELSNGTIEITDYYTLASRDVSTLEIPSTIEGKQVTIVGGLDSCDFTSIVIPDGVKIIRDWAFDHDGSLKSVTIPDSVTSIGSCAFYGCESLTSVTIPNGIKTIENGTFANCSNLTSVTIPSSVTTIGNGAFKNDQSLKSITIPSSVTSIEYDAFAGCTSLTSITIPKGVTEIADRTFNNCSSLTSVTIPDTVTAIGSEVFKSCTSLASITLPNSVESIGESSFAECTALKSISLPNKLEYVSDELFNGCTSLVSVSIPNGVTGIGSKAFYNCKKLAEITIPDSVITIGSNAFEECRALKSVTLSENLERVDGQAFYGCEKLTSITIPASIEKIRDYAFGYDGWTGTAEPIDGFKIYCYTGTEGLNYATSNGFDYEILHTHDYDTTITKAATCSTAGTVKYTCSCGDTYTESIPATGNHTVVTDKAVAATCVKAGKTEGSHCSVCNTVITAQKTVAATGKHTTVIDKAVAATCVSAGKTEGSHCSVCGTVITAQKTVAATGKHTYTSKVVKPTTSAQGYTIHTCSVCKTSYKDNYTAKLVALSKCKATIAKSGYAYTGKAIKPTVTVKNGSTKLKSGTDYTVSYKNNTKTGKATITITGKGKYTGTITKTFNIFPKKATLSSVKSTKTKTVKVTWKKDTQATGYEIVYATNSKFTSGKKTVTVSKNSTTSKTISKLTKGKTYYVKVRSYKTINGKKVYGAYSTVKKVKCK